MITIPFVKAHGAHNDFLLSWSDELPQAFEPADAARAICHRNTGAGADGWIVIRRGAPAAISLWNSDGSASEISGNGTRCVAALLVEQGMAGGTFEIATQAGLKQLRVIGRSGLRFSFEMNMGRAAVEDLAADVVPGRESVILNVGNPQCAVFVENFDFDWRSLGAKLERHARFPNRSNVSFIKVVDRHTLDVRFFERGAGETMSSGTGSTGAGAAAVARGLAESPVSIHTPAGPLELRWQDQDIFLTGPAEIVARGEFFWNQD